ncbi:MAG TPA: glycerophosphodiester phosphodiesterase, partial [Dehalococcoidia bacterium]
RTTTGSGPVREWTFQDLREQVELRGAPGQQVPTLAEALAVTRGRVPLAIEVKPGDAAEEVLRAVAEAGARRHVAVWSFRRSVIRAVQDLAPDVPCALLYGGARHGSRWTPGEFLCHARRLGVAAVSFFPEDLEPGAVEAARREGLQVYTGTVNEGRSCVRALLHGVDGIVTDQLAGMRALLAR